MVLVSLVLVVLAAVTLVIGLLQSGVAIIYVSIACSLVAGIVLFVAVRRGRPEAVGAGVAPGGGPGWAPQQPAGAQPAPSPQPSPQPVGAPSGAGGVAVAPPQPETAAAWAPDSTQQLEQVPTEDAEVDADGELPIAGYDRLRASDIMPLLADLDASQLQQVRAHEESRKHRFTVLRRIDDELAAREAAGDTGGWEVSEEQWEGEAEQLPDEPVVAEEVVEEEVVVEEEQPEEVEVPVGATWEVDEEEAVDEEEEEPEPIEMAPAPGGFPIPGYDQLMMLEILPRLTRLDPAELEQVRQHEAAGLSRSTILNRIDRLMEQSRGAGPAAASRASRAGPRKATPARKAVSRTPAKKAASTKRPAAKRAAAIRKAATKRAPAKKAVAKRAPAKKIAAKKTTTRSRKSI